MVVCGSHALVDHMLTSSHIVPKRLSCRYQVCDATKPRTPRLFYSAVNHLHMKIKVNTGKKNFVP
jgi:hypothetical protein